MGTRGTKGAGKLSRKRKYQVPGNDNLSQSFDAMKLIPERYRGTDRFLDVVCWNIRFFHDRDQERVDRVIQVLSALNADIVVMEEILDKSLDVVAQELTNRGVGSYTVAYGVTGGQQRIAVMHDLDWIRTKDDPRELFGRGEVTTKDGKDVFPRLPLWNSFTALTEQEPFDFQLLGVHLKSQRDGGADQRTLAARRLCGWLQADAPKVDSDVLILGDWNAPPANPEWKPFHDLEKKGVVGFRSVNDDSDFSHLMYQNKARYGTRLDIQAITTTAQRALQAKPAVARWTTLDELLATNPTAARLKGYIKDMREKVSDHIPVVSRFYFTDEDRD